MSWTKLHASLVHSTIWRESDKTRLVWITMLAIADRDGLVEASIPGLADAARVSIADTEAALQTLMAPDPYSRSKALDGRRIVEAPGGWQLVTYDDHRRKGNADEARAKVAERVRKHRARKRRVTPADPPKPTEPHGVTPVTPHVTQVTQNNPIAEADPETDPEAAAVSSKGPPGSARAAPPEAAAAGEPTQEPEPDSKVPCPLDLALAPMQLTNLALVKGVSEQAVTELTFEYVGSYLGKPTERRTLDAWRAGLWRKVSTEGQERTLKLKREPAEPTETEEHELGRLVAP